MSYANWFRRFLAQVIDMLILLPFLGVFAIGDVFLDGTALVWFGISLLFVAVNVSFYNRCIMMGRTGWSWGKMAMGIRVVSDVTGLPVGVPKTIAREFCHSLDMLTVVGMMLPLFPAWDRKGQTLADKFARTVVLNQRWTRAAGAA
jgi:uncharacterized RDD family membrane protein YckC